MILKVKVKGGLPVWATLDRNGELELYWSKKDGTRGKKVTEAMLESVPEEEREHLRYELNEAMEYRALAQKYGYEHI